MSAADTLRSGLKPFHISTPHTPKPFFVFVELALSASVDGDIRYTADSESADDLRVRAFPHATGRKKLPYHIVPDRFVTRSVLRF